MLSVQDIVDNLGMASLAEIADVEGQDHTFLQREILGRRSSFVALLRTERLRGRLVDRAQLAELVAQAVLGDNTGTGLQQFSERELIFGLR